MIGKKMAGSGFSIIIIIIIVIIIISIITAGFIIAVMNGKNYDGVLSYHKTWSEAISRSSNLEKSTEEFLANSNT